ncbi:MAG: Hsp70 family protein [Actinomycetia bacterium]|nr:Hsp70 family protein [Actinomycetes bacterium]
MTDPLGLSIGTTNLVAARIGRSPVLRRSILTVFADRSPQVGEPAENANPGESGVVLSGFVERVGDPAPLAAGDGSLHRGEQVLAAALEEMARLVDGGSPIAIAVPAYWGPGAVGALRGSLRSLTGLTPNGVPAAMIPDSAAALAALQVAPGLPDQGVIVLVDLGGGGSSITLADAGANLNAIGRTVRYPDFSGDALDRAMLDHTVARIAELNEANAAHTTASESLSRLLDECRKAKERLSAETAMVVPVELPGFRSDVPITRPEFEQLISEPFAGLLSAIEETLRQNGIPVADVSAVATVGGGAAIPLVTRQLSEQLGVPVVTTPQPQLNVAAGAALVANQSQQIDAPTGIAPTTEAPTAMSSAAWAAGVAGVAASESAVDGAASATFRALAWSEDDDSVEDPLPYTGDDYTSSADYADRGPTVAQSPAGFTPQEGWDQGELGGEPAPLPWYKRPPVLFGGAAAAALLALGGLAVTLTSSFGDSTPVTEYTTPSELPPPVTTVTVGPDGLATTTVSQPPAPPPDSTTTTPSTTTTTTTEPTTTTTTTTTAATTTTTRTTTTTTAPTTTSRTATTTQPTTTRPPTTTTAKPPPTTTTPPTLLVPSDGA